MIRVFSNSDRSLFSVLFPCKNGALLLLEIGRRGGKKLVISKALSSESARKFRVKINVGPFTVVNYLHRSQTKLLQIVAVNSG